ncbi:MAG: WecB/TagA/CpsF family glycosyltransferase [Chloroflexaceae bacterium]|nr:WecB/TagA/CpsF family glycosyltransferase [Chloroflexaceae bacterium]
MAVSRVNILGVGVSAIGMNDALRVIDQWILARTCHYVCVTNVHVVMECQRDEHLRRMHNSAGLVTPDGVPLVWLCWGHGFRHVERVYGPDLMLALCAHGQSRNYRHYFYGGAAGVAEQLTQRLAQRFPDLQTVGTYSPPFRPLTPDEDQQVVEMINAAQPDIVWVGLGAPRQERWIAAHVGRLTAPVLIGVGAAFDFHSGRKPQAPRWMQRNGLEWMFRFATEPRRLWQRYVLNNPLFVFLVMRQALGWQHYDLRGL